MKTILFLGLIASIVLTVSVPAHAAAPRYVCDLEGGQTITIQWPDVNRYYLRQPDSGYVDGPRLQEFSIPLRPITLAKDRHTGKEYLKFDYPDARYMHYMTTHQIFIEKGNPSNAVLVIKDNGKTSRSQRMDCSHKVKRPIPIPGPEAPKVAQDDIKSVPSQEPAHSPVHLVDVFATEVK